MASTTNFTTGPEWTNRFMAGIRVVHAHIGATANWRPHADLTPELALEILNALARHEYVPERFFTSATSSSAAISANVPELKAGQSYRFVQLNFGTARASAISVRTGGVLFEDPFWAVLACHLSPEGSLPVAPDNAALWRIAREISTAAKPAVDLPARFKSASPLPGNDPETPPVRLVEVTDAQAQALRSRGMQSMRVGDSLSFFELYQNK